MYNRICTLVLCTLFLTSVVLSGCSRIEDKGNVLSIHDTDLRCINGHLYKRIWNDNNIVTLYDYRTDKPTLIQCSRKNGKIEYETEKVK